MTVAERKKAEAKLYRRMAPDIVKAISEGFEPVHAAKQLARDYDLDDKLVYKWFQLTEADLERYRKRHSWTVLVPLWGGLLVAAGVFLMVVFGESEWSESWVRYAFGAAAVLFGTGVVLLPGLKRRAFRRKLQELTSDY
ncbi:MAG: hypothetical protein WCY01_06970 [Alkalispirochaeta sp.]|jgi:hypothetical protein